MHFDKFKDRTGTFLVIWRQSLFFLLVCELQLGRQFWDGIFCNVNFGLCQTFYVGLCSFEIGSYNWHDGCSVKGWIISVISFGLFICEQALIATVFCFCFKHGTLTSKAMLFYGVFLPFMSPAFFGAHMTVVTVPLLLSHTLLYSASLTQSFLWKCLG